MAGFVKSVERFQISLTGSAPISATANLTKDQDLSKTVAFCTAQINASVGKAVQHWQHACRVFDDAGTKKVEVSKGGSGTTTSIADVMVIEFGDSVTVQSGGPLLMSDASVTQTISAVNQSNSFIIFSHAASESSSSDRLERAFLQAKFNSNTEIQFARDSGSAPDPNIYWHVVESNGVDFQTEYAEINVAANATTASATLSNSVDLDHAFLVTSYQTNENGDDLRDGIGNMALTGATTLSWYRDHGGSPNATHTVGCWVVRSDANGFTTQRFATDIGTTATSINQTISTVDLDFAAIFSGQNIGIGDWPITSYIGGNLNPSLMMRIGFTSATNVQLNRRGGNNPDGNNNFARYEVVEFVEATAGLPPQTVVVGQVEETDSVEEVKPVAGAVSVSVGLVSETDTVLEVTPETSGEPQTVPVGLISEVDSVDEVKAVAGPVTVPVDLVSETDSVFEVKAVPGAVSVPVDLVLETDQVAPVFPLIEGGPQTVLVVNVAEIDAVFAVTPRLEEEEKPVGGIPSIRKPRRRYILPDNRVFEDPERALFELRRLLVQDQDASAAAESGAESPDPLEQEPASPSQEDSAPEPPPTPSMLSAAVQELPALLLARPEDAAPIDPQLLSVLFRMIDDEEAAILLL